MERTNNASISCQHHRKYITNIGGIEDEFIKLMRMAEWETKCTVCGITTHTGCKLCVDKPSETGAVYYSAYGLTYHIEYEHFSSLGMKLIRSALLQYASFDVPDNLFRIFPYQILLVLTSSSKDFIRNIKFLTRHKGDDYDCGIINYLLAEDYSCGICGEQYDTFPTFDVVREHVAACIQRRRRDNEKIK